jgi:hypothetical protein
MNIRLGARPYVALTEYEYARMLVSRAHAGDREHALSLISRASATAESLGMGALIAKAESLRTIATAQRRRSREQR